MEHAGTQDWRKTLPGAGLLVLAVLLAYSPVFHAGLVWDDDFHFASNPRMLGLGGLVDMWTSRSAVYYPLTLTTFWFLIRLFGMNPLVLHGFTLFVHLANVLLFWLALKKLRIRGAWFAAALFALHPVNVESVAWITELKNTQSTFFFLTTLLLLEKAGRLGSGSQPPARVWDYAALGSFGLAVLSKPAVIMLPAMLVVLLWRAGRLGSWQDVKWTAPFFAMSILAASWTIWEQRYSSGATGFEWSQSLPARFALSGHIFWFYLYKLAWPLELMFIYPRWEITGTRVTEYIPVLTLAVLMASCWWYRRLPAIRELFFGLVLFLVLLFPVTGFFNIYFTRYSFVSDHFLYLPALPLFVLAGALLFGTAPDSSRPFVPPSIRPFLALLLLLPLAVLTNRHTHAFHDEASLWDDTLRKNPGAWMVHNNLGARLLTLGDLDGARGHFEEALRYNPEHYEAMVNLGNILLRRERLDEAIPLYQRALALRPDYPLAWVNLGLAHDRAGAPGEAVRCFQRALEFDPRYVEAYVKMAGVRERQDRPEDAVAAFRKALEYGEHGPAAAADFYQRRAAEQAAAGHPDIAAAYREEALRLLQKPQE